jgi:hypothetical protein
MKSTLDCVNRLHNAIKTRKISYSDLEFILTILYAESVNSGLNQLNISFEEELTMILEEYYEKHI